MPIIPPTEEAVREMLTGTDLPPDHVVAKIPPRMGKATVEAIAVNAVMAGALPTYMPVIIAAVQAMMDPKIEIEGYSCSMASWAPLWIINGPIRHDLHVNSGRSLMSPYYKANTAIGHALGLITLNIGGVRPGIEDMGFVGHEGRAGMCIAENEEESPWEPMHVQYGLKKEDNAVSGFWPHARQLIMNTGVGAASILRDICKKILATGFNPGSAIIITPATARELASEGWTKEEAIAYIAEFSRRPTEETERGWLLRNFHQPRSLVPLESTTPMRQFFTTDHLVIIVSGGSADTPGITAYNGGGDYGGPVTKKIELPKNWPALVKKYKDIVPVYAHY